MTIHVMLIGELGCFYVVKIYSEVVVVAVSFDLLLE